VDMHLFAFVKTVSQLFVIIPTIFFMFLFLSLVPVPMIDKGKVFPLQARCGPEGG